MGYASRAEFVADVRRAQVGDTGAQDRLRKYADDPRMRREAAERAQRKNPQAVARKRADGTSAHRRAERSSSTVRTPHRISRSVLDAVIRLLGVACPVSILWVEAGDVLGANGDHRFMGDEHVIRLRNDQSPSGTNRTLLHELAHAASAGGYGNPDAWKRAYNAEPDRFEAEANEVARLLSHVQVIR